MCNEEKPRNQFYFNHTCKDNCTPKCCSCIKKMNHLYYLRRKEQPKEQLLPFIYHPVKPIVPPPDPENLKIQHCKITLEFP